MVRTGSRLAGERRERGAVSAWLDIVVPLATKGLLMDGERLHLGFGDDHALWGSFRCRVWPSLACRGASVSDELHHSLEGSQRLTTPVLCDVTEEAMFDAVPLTLLPPVSAVMKSSFVWG